MRVGRLSAISLLSFVLLFSGCGFAADTSADRGTNPKKSTAEEYTTSEFFLTVGPDGDLNEPSDDLMSTNEDNADEDISDEPELYRQTGKHCSLAFDPVIWDDMGNLGIDTITINRGLRWDQNTNFNITEVEIGITNEVSAAAFEPLIDDQYADLGYEIVECTDTYCAGYKAAYVEIKAKFAGVDKRLGQVVIWENGYQFCFSCASVEEEFDNYYPVFMEIANSIEIF